MAYVWAAKLRIMLCFVRYVVFAKFRVEKYYPKFGGPLKLAALCGRTPNTRQRLAMRIRTIEQFECHEQSSNSSQPSRYKISIAL